MGRFFTFIRKAFRSFIAQWDIYKIKQKSERLFKLTKDIKKNPNDPKVKEWEEEANKVRNDLRVDLKPIIKHIIQKQIYIFEKDLFRGVVDLKDLGYELDDLITDMELAINDFLVGKIKYPSATDSPYSGRFIYDIDENTVDWNSFYVKLIGALWGEYWKPIVERFKHEITMTALPEELKEHLKKDVEKDWEQLEPLLQKYVVSPWGERTKWPFGFVINFRTRLETWLKKLESDRNEELKKPIKEQDKIKVLAIEIVSILLELVRERTGRSIVDLPTTMTNYFKNSQAAQELIEEIHHRFSGPLIKDALVLVETKFPQYRLSGSEKEKLTKYIQDEFKEKVWAPAQSWARFYAVKLKEEPKEPERMVIRL